MSTCVAQYPPELLSSICAAVYHAGIPAANSSLDPLSLNSTGTPTALPSSYPASHWPEPLARRTLANLCLVNHAWFEAAKPWLWRRIEVRLPRSWMAFVEQIIGGEEELDENVVDETIKKAASAVLTVKSPGCIDDEAARKLQESLIATLSLPDSSIPFELLTPPASREPSPRRLRAKSKSPARWKVLKSINEALQDAMERDGVYMPTPLDPHPGRYVRYLDFNHFRAIGMRRSDEEGVKGRFVTAERLINVLKETPNLAAFGATEYMDGALSFSVLKELLLRGSPSRGRGRSSRGRSLTVETDESSDELDRERLRDCKELVALDLTGCISAVFYNGLNEFVRTFIDVGEDESSGDERERGRGGNAKTPMFFPGLQRLGLLGVKSIQPSVLHSFVLAFPSLTHLDLSGTRVTPELLEALGDSPTVRLESLAIARCTRLTGDSIADFLIHGRAARYLTQLNIYGDATFPSSLSEQNLLDIITQAPCFKSGKLEYLDLSSSPLTAEHLRLWPEQPSLRSLGLSYIPLLPLGSLISFLRDRARNVEVLSLISSTPELVANTPFKASMALHGQLIQSLALPPVSISFTISSSGIATPAEETTAPTRLRVIELGLSMLNSLGAGAGTWRIIRSKGGRGWYVDTACGWVAESGSESVLKRNLSRSHPLRAELEMLADANGNVNSGVGWHARKMEILHGHGLLGREDGLYGAVSFAYQG